MSGPEAVHAILLAAGVSRRLRGFVDDRPKCLLELGGRTLLARHLDAIAGCGVPRLTIVTGYRAGQIEAALEGETRIRVDTRRNDRFTEGSILSLAIGLTAVDEGHAALAMDADVLYHPEILARLVDAGDGFLLDETSEETGEEMMLGARDGRVRTIARSVGTDWDEVGEGVGFFLCPAEDVPALALTIEETIARDGPTQEYESALDAFLEIHPAPYQKVGDRPWLEIDFPTDVERAQNLLLRHDI